MFESSNLFALMDNGSGRRSFRVERVSLDEGARSDLVKSFSEQSIAFVNPDNVMKEIRDYCPGYTADIEDEINRIGGFKLPQQIVEALDNPLSLPIYEPLDDQLPLIRALFVGESTEDGIRVALQRFRQYQYLKAASIRLWFDKDTLAVDGGGWKRSPHRVGLCVLPTVDVFFDRGSLLFSSFYYANQIFDLAEYSKPVTQPQIDDLFASELLEQGDTQYTLESFNSWELKRLSSIYASEVLDKCSIKDLKKAAKKIDYTLPMENDKLAFPKEKKDRKKFLSFLNEDIFTGLLTRSTFESNSKRQL